MGKGEELCAMKDDRKMLEKKIIDSNGVIFAAPTDLGNVSRLMKNMADRFCYISHRPRFFNNALALTTSGFHISSDCWLVKQVLIIISSNHRVQEKTCQKIKNLKII